MANDSLGNLFSKMRASMGEDDAAPDEDEEPVASAPPDAGAPIGAPVAVSADDGPSDDDVVTGVVAAPEVVAAAAPPPRPTPPARPAAPVSSTPGTPGELDVEVELIDLLELAPVEPEPSWPAFSVAESATLDDPALRRRRDASVASASGALAPLVKRLLQDEQNELLDAVRRLKARTPVESVIPDEDTWIAAWVEVLREAVDDVYAAGRVLGGGRTRPAPADLVERLAEVLVVPRYDRVVETLTTVLRDSGAPGPDRQRLVAGAVGARYREWRAQELDVTLGDALTWAYARGVYDATPEGTTMRWLPAEVEQCPDADDNALEPTCKGRAFPTGQSCPPAHPGCRCLVVPVVV